MAEHKYGEQLAEILRYALRRLGIRETHETRTGREVGRAAPENLAIASTDGDDRTRVNRARGPDDGLLALREPGDREATCNLIRNRVLRSYSGRTPLGNDTCGTTLRELRAANTCSVTQ